MRVLLTASMILAFSAVPAAAQQFTNFGSELRESSKYERHAESFGNCVVRANPQDAAAYVRTQPGSDAARSARTRLDAAYAACGSHLARWGYKRTGEPARRDAVLAALHRYRGQMASLN